MNEKYYKDRDKPDKPANFRYKALCYYELENAIRDTWHQIIIKLINLKNEIQSGVLLLAQECNT